MHAHRAQLIQFQKVGVALHTTQAAKHIPEWWVWLRLHVSFLSVYNCIFTNTIELIKIGQMCRQLANYVLSLITYIPISLYSGTEGRDNYYNAIAECRNNRDNGPSTLAVMLVEGALRGWNSLLYHLEEICSHLLCLMLLCVRIRNPE